MGMNTIALLNEACHDDWPAEIREAALCGQDPGPAGFSVNFSYGRILARAPEGACVMVSVRGNTGVEIEHGVFDGSSRKNRHTETILRRLRELLCGHGYTVRRPGRSRGEGPLSWGFADEVRMGKQSLPEISPIASGSGTGVVVILLNDMTSRWPEEMRNAMGTIGIKGRDGSFGYGRVLSVAHADYIQIAGIAGATGQALRPDSFVDPRFLDLAAQTLLRHGYAFRAPGAKRYAEPDTAETI